MSFAPGTPPADADDHALAAWLATVAGERLLEVRGEGLEGRELKDAGVAPSACLRSGSVGILVEYGDHTVRPDDLRIKAECKGAPPAPPKADDPLGVAIARPPAAKGPS